MFSTPLLTVPVELEMFASFKELYLYNNRLQTLFLVEEACGADCSPDLSTMKRSCVALSKTCVIRVLAQVQ